LDSQLTTFFSKNRTVKTQSFSSDTTEILTKQRLVRPVAPHLTIYQPQITWFASGAHRLAGVLVSGGLYLYMMAYVVAPTLGWHIESSVLAASFAAWPVALKAAAKATVAFPFVFHSLNGLRHLAWDLGIGFAKQQVIRTGWFVIGLSAVSTAYLTFF
jgi:succinate dehydrogenase (ubiquinone) cytochrome b560 subunit